MSKNMNEIRIEDLEKLLEKGTPLIDSLEKIGEERSAYIIKQIGDLQLRSNTVGGCSIGMQYCGCENWVK
jgi:hypothetical protein